MSLLRYIASEVTRSYGLEDDEDMYTTKREKMYTFMRIPRYEIRTGSEKPIYHQGAGEVHVLRILPLPGLLPLHIHLPPAQGELVVGGLAHLYPSPGAPRHLLPPHPGAAHPPRRHHVSVLLAVHVPC